MAVALMLGVTFLAASASGASGQSAASGSSATAAQALAVRAALRGLHLGAPLQLNGEGQTLGPDTISTLTSPNWSGYVDTNHTKEGAFRNIAATWHVPEITSGFCASFQNNSMGLSSFWVGLDGDGSNTVEQTGTMSECYNGSAYYFDWWEMYPDTSVIVDSVNAGDEISAYVDYTGEYYLLSLVDDTQDTSFSELESCPSGSTCNNYSAEAVAESPGGCVSGSGQDCRVQGPNSFFPLSDFNYVSFYAISDATFKYGGSLATGNFGPANLTMETSSNEVLAKVTTLWHNDGFYDSWKNTG
jgi:hypothetical protein